MRIILSGASGQMGKTIIRLLSDSKEHSIVAGFAIEEEQYENFKVYKGIQDIEEEADIIIDFSNYTTLRDLLSFAKKRRLPLILATTGHSKEDLEEIRKASKEIAILKSNNLSLGINLMEEIVEKLSRLLEDFDIEIVEKHHRYKLDSPSGTAKMLFDAANKGREGRLKELDGRAGFYQERDKNEVGISAIRGGNIVGEHSVLFCGQDEIIEIKHQASSKLIFAKGAIKAGEYLVNKESGLHTMSDVLGDEDE